MLARRARQCRDTFRSCLENSSRANEGWLWGRHASFGLWAADTGATLDNLDSLDYRLKNRPDLRNVISRLISVLQNTLQRYEHMFALEDLHLKKPFELDNIRDELQDPTSIYSQRLLLSMNPPIDVPLKTQQYCFSGPSSEISFRLIGAIDQLERLAIVIKGSGSLADHGEADEALVIDEYADFIQSLQLYLLKRLMSHNKDGMAVLSSASYPYSRDLAKSISTEEALRLRQRPITPTVISVQDRLIKGNVQRRNRILYARRNANVLVRDQRVQEECLMYERVLPSINLAESKVEEPLLESGTPVLPSATAAIEVDSTFDFSLRPRSPNITVPETAAGATVNFPRPPLRDNNTSESVK